MPHDPREVLARPAPPPDLTVAYGGHSDQVADVWLPGGGAPAPLVMFLHGGFWRAEYDRAHTGPLAADLAARGYAVASLEYRRVGQPGGGWPGTFDDVAVAVDTIPHLVAVAEPGRIDPTRTVLAGHSAGGHLALWAACRHALPEGARWHRRTPLPLAGVLALAPVCDLTEAYRRDLDLGAVTGLLGGDPNAVPDRYAAVDPARLPAPAAQCVIVHGTLDAHVPVELSRTYAARAGQVRLVELPEVEHFGLIDPLERTAWPAVLAALRTLTPEP